MKYIYASLTDVPTEIYEARLKPQKYALRSEWQIQRGVCEVYVDGLFTKSEPSIQFQFDFEDPKLVDQFSSSLVLRDPSFCNGQKKLDFSDPTSGRTFQNDIIFLCYTGFAYFCRPWSTRNAIIGTVSAQTGCFNEKIAAKWNRQPFTYCSLVSEEVTRPFAVLRILLSVNVLPNLSITKSVAAFRMSQY